MKMNGLNQNTPKIDWNPWREYVDAAWWCAARNLKGKIGDPLPQLLSREALEFINEDPEAFESYVRMCAYARAIRRIKHESHIPLTEDENYVLSQNCRWGSDMYPVSRVSWHHWTWGPIRSIQGPDIVFKTKREAIDSFEKYLESLRQRKAEQSRRRDAAEHQNQAADAKI